MPNYEEHELISLAEMLDESRKANKGNADRAQVIKRFEKRFNKILTPGKLAALYRKYLARSGKKVSPQAAFIKHMLRRKLELNQKAGIVERIDPVTDFVPDDIERPPQPEHALLPVDTIEHAPEPLPQAEPPKEPVMTRTAPSQKPELPFDIDAAQRALDGSPRYTTKDITPDMKAEIAINFGVWGEGAGTSSRFRGPAAYAAFAVNARRKNASDPILGAETIEDLIGTERRTKAWLLEQNAFVARFNPTPAEAASSVMRRMPPFIEHPLRP